MEVKAGDAAWPHNHHGESDEDPGVGDAGHDWRPEGKMLFLLSRQCRWFSVIRCGSNWRTDTRGKRNHEICSRW